MIAPGPDAFDAIMRRGRPALAWEVLRRDSGYQAVFARLAKPLDPCDAAAPAFVADWGLHFP